MYDSCNLYRSSPILVMAMNVNAMVVNTQVSVLKLDTNVFKQQLNTHALAPHFQTVLNDGVKQRYNLSIIRVLRTLIRVSLIHSRLDSSEF